MTREDLDFIGSMNMCDEISNDAYKKIVCHCEEQNSILDKIRDEINNYGSIRVRYKIIGHTDQDIKNIVENVLKQAKEQVLDIIDKYRVESEDKE